MARTVVSYTQLTPNSHTTSPAGTTIDSTLVSNGVVVNGIDPEHTLIRVSNSATSAKNVTVRAGSGIQAWMAGQGDLTVNVGANTGLEFVGPFTSARFQQDGSSLYIDFDSGFTGTLTVFHMPKAWN
ncbi:hypothetical protein [Streptomyces griseofuscus]|uniref:hypothetical protein n=1 Tax=Streptomyces griseofuscus TaxID=146922 RepID=UPI0036A12263